MKPVAVRPSRAGYAAGAHVSSIRAVLAHRRRRQGRRCSAALLWCQGMTGRSMQAQAPGLMQQRAVQIAAQLFTPSPCSRLLHPHRAETLTGDNSGFKLIFRFAENPYFTNEVRRRQAAAVAAAL